MLAGLVGLAGLPVLAACQSQAGAPSASGSSAAAGFRWTDARGKVIDLPTRPTVLVAQSSAAAALWDAGIKVKGAYGELQTTNGKLDYQAGNLDLAQLTVIGKTYGDFQVEKLAGLSPQLLIDLSFDNKTLWYVDAATEKKVEALCPTLGMEMLNKNLVQVIEEFTKLAVALGADPNTSGSAKQQFDAAADKTKAAIAAANGGKVAVFSFDSNNAYVANPKQNPDLAYLTTLGAQFVDSGSKPTDYFNTISFEKLGDYDADVVMVDARNTYTGYKQLSTWKALSGVKQGNVFPWYPAAPYSYLSSTKIMDDFTTVWQAFGR